MHWHEWPPSISWHRCFPCLFKVSDCVRELQPGFPRGGPPEIPMQNLSHHWGVSEHVLNMGYCGLNNAIFCIFLPAITRNENHTTYIFMVMTGGWLMTLFYPHYSHKMVIEIGAMMINHQILGRPILRQTQFNEHGERMDDLDGTSWG